MAVTIETVKGESNKYFSLKDLNSILDEERKSEGPTNIKSKSLLIVFQVIQGKKIHEDLWNYLKDKKNQGLVIDTMHRMPHTRLDEKKKMIDILHEQDYFNGNNLRTWCERFNGSEELTRYLLEKETGFFLKEPQAQSESQVNTGP